jgi:hypothetical protein
MKLSERLLLIGFGFDLTLGLVLVFEVVDGTFSRHLVRFDGGNSDGFFSAEISKSGRL